VIWGSLPKYEEVLVICRELRSDLRNETEESEHDKVKFPHGLTGFGTTHGPAETRAKGPACLFRVFMREFETEWDVGGFVWYFDCVIVA
jgi:hypothetical protein